MPRICDYNDIFMNKKINFIIFNVFKELFFPIKERIDNVLNVQIGEKINEKELQEINAFFEIDGDHHNGSLI